MEDCPPVQLNMTENGLQAVSRTGTMAHAIWLYFRFALSRRLVEKMLPAHAFMEAITK
jgi:transposase-like protein